MALTTQEKKETIKDHKVSQQDTGSTEIQVALLTLDINKLQEHFAKNKKDNHSRRGLLRKVNMRRKLLDYLKRKSEDRYKKLITRLHLRR